ncbi:MAG: hypothetical protein ABR521_14310 [Gaiellaceae bacterium]
MKRRSLLITCVGGILIALPLLAGFLRGGHTAQKATLAKAWAPAMMLAGGRATPSAMPRGYVPATAAQPIVRMNDHHDTSLPLRELAKLPAHPSPPRPTFEPEGPRPGGGAVRPDPFQQPYRQRAGGPKMPAPIINVQGVINTDNSNPNLFPPDTQGDVGPNHYWQWVNQEFEVFNKSGNSVLGPVPGNTLWTGFGGLCETTNFGDPIVLYDKHAGRWLGSQFAFTIDASGNAAPPYTECIAISQTSDPTGPFHRYAFTISNTRFNDYPKFGVWPDAYYMSINQFGDYPDDPLSFKGWGAVAFERDRMLQGLSAQMVYVDTNQLYLPIATDLDGTMLPPAGEGGLFFDWEHPNGFHAKWELTVDWVTPANSTLVGPTVFASGPFNPSGTDVPQPGTSARLDSIDDRLMYRAAYRNFGTHQSVVFNQATTIDANQVGTRWLEVRSPHGTPVTHQQGTYTGDTADGHSRWMGSIAMDNDGNAALGYSISSSSVFPGVRYVGRLATDPLNTLPQGEATMQDGSGSQTGTFRPNLGRWGDYSMMGIDPIDDCTFWYTQEYYDTTAPVAWRTRIGSFRFPTCAGPTMAGVTRFAAARTKAGVALSWRSQTESTVLGYNVWRGNAKVNRTLIAAKKSGKAAGSAYRFVDRAAPAGRSVKYRLQVVDLKGGRAWYGERATAAR